jgi:hypothetical protein
MLRPLFQKNLDMMNWFNLSWYYLSANPNAIHLLEANPEKIDWVYLSYNPNAIHLLEANPAKINWECLGKVTAFSVKIARETIECCAHSLRKISTRLIGLIFQ